MAYGSSPVDESNSLLNRPPDLGYQLAWINCGYVEQSYTYYFFKASVVYVFNWLQVARRSTD
jgi:hypothetical protein